MTGKWMMTTAAALAMIGLVAVGCGKSDEQKAAADRPATPSEAQSMEKANADKMATEGKANTAMTDAKAKMGAATQQATDAAKNAGAAMGEKADQLKMKMKSTTMPSTPGM